MVKSIKVSDFPVTTGVDILARGRDQPEWGCEGASSMEQQTALNAAWVAEADAVLLEHYASFFDSPR